MLILRNNEQTEGTWFDFQIKGETIRLKIRPMTAEIFQSIRERHKKIQREKDFQTGKVVKVENYNEQAISDELIDHILEDFKGIGEAPDRPLEPTLENKKRVMSLFPVEGEQSIADFVFEKARELAVLTEQEIKAQEKNSRRSQAGSMTEAG